MWMWRHGSLDYDVYDDVEEAIEDAAWADWLETGVLQCIETAEGKILPDDPRLREAHDNIADDERRDEEESRVEYKWRVDIFTPDASWQGLGWYVDREDAEADAEPLIEIIGPERLRILPIFGN